MQYDCVCLCCKHARQQRSHGLICQNKTGQPLYTVTSSIRFCDLPPTTVIRRTGAIRSDHALRVAESICLTSWRPTKRPSSDATDRPPTAGNDLFKKKNIRLFDIHILQSELKDITSGCHITPNQPPRENTYSHGFCIKTWTVGAGPVDLTEGNKSMLLIAQFDLKSLCIQRDISPAFLPGDTENQSHLTTGACIKQATLRKT